MAKNMKKNLLILLIIGIVITIGIFFSERISEKNKRQKIKETAVIFNLGSNYNTLDPHLLPKVLPNQRIN